MKKAIIIATVLSLSGLIIAAAGLAFLGFDFTQLNTSEYITEEYAVKEDFAHITVLTQLCDVTLVPSNEDECKIVTRAPEKTKFTVDAESGCLAVREKDTRKWHEFIGVNFGESSVTVYLPKTEYGILTVESDTGDVTIPQEISFESAKLSTDTGDITASSDMTESLTAETDTGDIKVQGISAVDLWIESDTGDVEISDVSAKEIVSVESDTGDVHMTQVRCENLYAENDTGSLILTDTVSSLEAKLSTDTGDVVLDAFDAHDIFVETSTGDVTGTILSDKVFFAKSETGKEDVPYCLTGGACEVKSDTGDIKLSIEK